MSIWQELAYFSAEEFGEHADEMNEHLLYLLDATRELADMPIYITSGVRPSDVTSEHFTGEGVDVSDNLDGDPISSVWRYHVLHGAFAAGFIRIGVYDRHLHLGVSRLKAPDVLWIGKSS